MTKLWELLYFPCLNSCYGVFRKVISPENKVVAFNTIQLNPGMTDYGFELLFSFHCVEM